MATNKRVFTLRLSDEVFDKIGFLATAEHRSMTNYIEYVLIKHLKESKDNTKYQLIKKGKPLYWIFKQKVLTEFVACDTITKYV